MKKQCSVFRRTWTDAEEKSFFIRSFVFLSESDKFELTSISCCLLKFCVICF